MPYNNIAEAKADGFPHKIDGVELHINQINALSIIYDALKNNKDLDNPMAVAIAQFKTNHKIDGGQWVKMSEDVTSDWANYDFSAGIDGINKLIEEADKLGVYFVDDSPWLLFKERTITSLSTSQAAMSYHNRLHAMYMDNRQTKRAFSKSWVEGKHRELVDWMTENGWTHPKRGDVLDKTVESFSEKERDDIIRQEIMDMFDESGLKEGKAVLVLELGKECASADGKERVTVTEAMCKEIEGNYNEGHHPGLEKYGAPIDADHKLINLAAKEPVKEPTSLDRVFGYTGARVFYKAKKGLMAAAPFWNERIKAALKVIKRIGISAAFGPYYAKRGPKAGQKVGYTLYNFTLVSTPQQGSLMIGPEMLRDIFGEDKKPEIYISKPIIIDFEEDEEMGIEFTEDTIKALGDNPQEKVTALLEVEKDNDARAETVKVFCEAIGVDDLDGAKSKIEQLEKRPEAADHVALTERVAAAEKTLNDKESAEREKIALEEKRVITPAELDLQWWKDMKNPVKTERKTFDEFIDNRQPVAGAPAGTGNVPGEPKTFDDPSLEFVDAVAKVMKEKEVDREKAESIVFTENPDLAARYQAAQFKQQPSA